jgi:hypothetical protein
MNATCGTYGISTDGSVRFARMVQDEQEQVLFRKAAYDIDFPDHARSLSLDRLAEIARHRVVEKLCRPPETAEVAIVADGESSLSGMHIA